MGQVVENWMGQPRNAQFGNVKNLIFHVNSYKGIDLLLLINRNNIAASFFLGNISFTFT